MNDTFLIWSEKHGAWWRPYSRGYTTSIVEAGRYSADSTRSICDNSNFGGTFNSLPVPVPAGIPDRERGL